MTKLSVPDMHCEMCVSRITKAMDAKGIDVTVSLEDHSVTVLNADAEIAEVKEMLDDLGFPVE